jgi:hypothetical protein
MMHGTTAGLLIASLYLAAAPPAGWAAECTAGQCSCFGDDDCSALFESGQCLDGTQVRSMTEMASLCSLEAKQIVLGSCRQVPSRRDIAIAARTSERPLAFPHLSKNCGG